MTHSAGRIRTLLGLEDRTTCGFTRETYRSGLELPADVLPGPFGGSRALGNALYFLVAPDAPVLLHRIRSDQMYHHYEGAPLEVLLLHLDGTSEIRVVGHDLVAGVHPQLAIPGGTFHSARVAETADYALLATSVWLRAEPPDVEMGDPAKLGAAYPDAKASIEAFTRG